MRQVSNVASLRSVRALQYLLITSGLNSVFHNWAAPQPRNWSAVDPVEMLTTGSADMVIGGVFPTAQRYNSFELSGVYTTDSVRCYLVRSHTVPRWQYPFAVLSAKTWAFLGGAMLCVGRRWRGRCSRLCRKAGTGHGGVMR